MTDAKTSESQITALLARVEELEKRLEELEDFSFSKHPPGEVSDEVLMAISAACAAYLGKRPVIKHVHHHRKRAWANQGRRAIQTSHNLH